MVTKANVIWSGKLANSMKEFKVEHRIDDTEYTRFKIFAGMLFVPLLILFSILPLASIIFSVLNNEFGHVLELQGSFVGNFLQ